MQARNTLLRWRSLAVYLLVAWSLSALIPSYLAIAPPRPLLGDPQLWTLSAGAWVEGDHQKLTLAAATPGAHWASRALEFSADAEFARIGFCLEQAVPPETGAVLMASVREGQLDFNRQYRVNSFYSGELGECFSEAIPRRAGDGAAVFQLQLLQGPAALSLETLTVTPERENPVWRITRMSMLLLGLGLLAVVLSSYRHERPRWLVFLGMVIVVGILFGCCVSVSLKADIYALLTGGRSIDAGVSMDALLEKQFPIGGFSLFTYLHAVLFCGATFFLALARPQGWIDMLMLAPLTETLQLFVPGRGPGTSDMLVDWTGVALALPLVFLLRRSQRVRALLEH
ncbi:hypothetical protein [Congregibacter litoralis]|uniref:VanZ like family n=1 Tax=Congregibacter litoralis KT71 TaxID=314285 RepID=A4A387_9GAMM|nr:hypothetical protein [Congregibacter litoralis]EAQ99160.1 hypothetical protein KT71_15861 [Congregibacter litoralis KT71]